jgi:hypothetical protein
LNNERITIALLAREAKAMHGQGDSLENVLDRVFMEHNVDHTGRYFLSAEIRCRLQGSYPDPGDVPENVEKLVEILVDCASVYYEFHDGTAEKPILDAVERAYRFYKIPLQKRRLLRSKIRRQLGKAGGHQNRIIKKKETRNAAQATL